MSSALSHPSSAIPSEAPRRRAPRPAGRGGRWCACAAPRSGGPEQIMSTRLGVAHHAGQRSGVGVLAEGGVDGVGGRVLLDRADQVKDRGGGGSARARRCRSACPRARDPHRPRREAVDREVGAVDEVVLFAEADRVARQALEGPGVDEAPGVGVGDRFVDGEAIGEAVAEEARRWSRSAAARSSSRTEPTPSSAPQSIV